MLSTLLLLTSFVSAGDVPQSFAHLKKVDIGGEATIYVDPSVQCKPVDVTSIQTDGDTGYQGPPSYDVCTLEIVKGTKVQITFTSGPSDDPYFQFLPIVPKGKNAPSSILDVGATTLYIPKGKNVYSEGWCNTMFNERRKFTFDLALATQKSNNPTTMLVSKRQFNQWEQRQIKCLLCCTVT